MEDGCEKEIEKQLRKRGLTKDKDVSEIYLAIRGLEEVNDFGRFRNLQVLWLNGNKLRKVNCLASNYQLMELYLQDNMIVALNGSLRHLTCLQVLLLNGNQLLKLTDVVHELKAMQFLKTLRISKAERDKAEKKYESQREMINEGLAFGQCSYDPLKKMPTALLSGTLESYGLSQGDYQEKQIRTIESTSNSGSALEEVIKRRGFQRSVMQYSTFDWSSIPLSEERRLLPESSPDQPRILTVRFR